MRNALHGKKSTDLFAEAEALVATTGCDRPDRLARRHRAALVCWFCQNDAGRVKPLQAATIGGPGNDESSGDWPDLDDIDRLFA
jgi:hypothetical protein